MLFALIPSYVTSPSESDTVGSLNCDSSRFALVGQPKKVQLQPPKYLPQLFAINFKIQAQVKQEKYNRYTVIRALAPIALYSLISDTVYWSHDQNRKWTITYLVTWLASLTIPLLLTVV